ncbi:MAG: Ger(x)C family spore germination protein [Clostridiales bacterium]|nr:Ger(x)C family spore germination protein [Clostridiales bacterium]
MYRKTVLLCLISVSLIISSGCWDRVEIERNAFILGLAIDLNEDEDLVLTYQVALLDAFKGEDEEKSKSTQEISITSGSLSQATNSLLTYLGNVPNFAHCKLIVFGEEYAKKGIKGSLDFLFRETRMRRTTTVCISEGQGKDIFKMESKMAPSPAMEIDQIITENFPLNNSIFPFHDIGYLYRNFISGSDVCLIRVKPNKETVSVSGAGVLKDFRLIGWYTEDEIQGQRYLLGEPGKGTMATSVPWEKGGEITLKSLDISSSVTPKMENNKMKIVTTIMVEGDIDEIENSKLGDDIKTPLKTWENAIEDNIRHIVHSCYEKGRDIYNADTFGIDKRVEAYYPKFWEANKGDWGNAFKNIDIDLTVDVKIRRLGVIGS